MDAASVAILLMDYRVTSVSTSILTTGSAASAKLNSDPRSGPTHARALLCRIVATLAYINASVKMQKRSSKFAILFKMEDPSSLSEAGHSLHLRKLIGMDAPFGQRH